MSEELLMYLKELVPAFFVLGGFIIGLIVEAIFRPHYKKAGDCEGFVQMLFCSMRGLFMLLFALIGGFAAVHYMGKNLSAEAHDNIIMGMITIAIIGGTILIARLSAGMIEHLNRKSGGRVPNTTLIENVLKITVYILGVLVLLDYYGVSILPMLTALGWHAPQKSIQLQ
ncbi:MAG: hypothetical protein U5N86_09540 [Planctomycetota bacterium]|nr:hypothetical protein [Planctomycetota bacterium]